VARFGAQLARTGSRQHWPIRSSVDAGPWTFGWEALVAFGTIGLALFASVQLWQSNLSERRRSQPVAVANGAGGPDLGHLYVFLTNHGTGTAFNVRCGVRLDGREFACGGGRGLRFTLSPGERQPPEEQQFGLTVLEVNVPLDAYVRSPKGVGIYERRVYWARYENALGQTWETANPADPYADFTISHRSVLGRVFRRPQEQAGAAAETTGFVTGPHIELPLPPLPRPGS
jgi:hypothetical protein